MQKSATLALAAALALSGVTAATASEMSNHAAKTSTAKISTTKAAATRTAASDMLSLSNAQQKSIWSDVSRQASNQYAPLGFDAAVGTALPSSVSVYTLPSKAERDVPALKPYRYAMLQDKILIVNPSDRKIADVVTR
jgi:hypothetical protein